MPNQINRDIYVLSSKVKDPIDYVRLTNDIPIVFTFRDYDIPPGSAAQVYVQKPSGKAVYDKATISGNVVTVTVTDQMFAELGVSDLQIRITQGDEKLVSFSQPVRVHPNYTDGDAEQSKNTGGFFDDAEQAVENANQATGLANQAAQAANEAAEAVREAVSGVINDDQASTLTTYSSSKIDEKLQQQTQETVIDDSTTSDTKTFSSQKISNLIGALSSLTTEQRSNIVSAINELVERINNQDTNIDDFDQRLSNEENQVDFITDTIIGDRDNLDTTDKSSIVSAINEVNGKIGDLTQLDTDEKTDLVSAMNEVYSEAKNQAADYIIESSMNPNGYWIKYNSGKMEVWGVSSFSTPISNTDTWLFYSDEVTVTFPIKFESIYSVQASSSNGSGTWPCITGNGLTLSGFKAWLYCATQYTSPVSGQIMYHAFGTWK